MSKKGKDGLLLNKILAGVLTAGIVLWAANRIAGAVVDAHPPEKPAIAIAGLQPQATQAVAAGPASVAPLIAGADVAKGQAFAQQQCAACHSFNQGGADGVGPNLYGVMGAAMFSGNFSYSDAVKAKAKGNWDYDTMNAWLDDPGSFAPGTAMSYPGIKNTETRADVIAYLRSLSPHPLPLPSKSAAAVALPAATTAPGAAPAGGSSIDSLFAKADLAKGQSLVDQQCQACHSFNKGGEAGVGPNLYGIVGAKMFAQSGFSYSDAAKSKAGGSWTPETMSDWLKDPMAFAPGTAMSYPGIKNDQTRADVIAYLNKNSDHPVPLPGTK